MARLVLVCMTIVFAFAFATSAGAQNAWNTITDPIELRKLVTGKVLDGGDFMHYFRQDGNAAVDFGGPRYPGLSVRKWTIKGDGKLCVAPFSKPNKVAECYTFQRKSGNALKYRYRSRTGFHPFKVIDTVPAKLSKAVKDKAGPLR